MKNLNRASDAGPDHCSQTCDRAQPDWRTPAAPLVLIHRGGLRDTPALQLLEGDDCDGVPQKMGMDREPTLSRGQRWLTERSALKADFHPGTVIGMPCSAGRNRAGPGLSRSASAVVVAERP
ncbi:hypothetical protein [Streptomyces sp. NPDC101149]|uniref:hypothetical protein n=1 Tax=Streptomyces sp. NPDC101149 TaxID=3366113 RepID=UPI00382C0503